MNTIAITKHEAVGSFSIQFDYLGMFRILLVLPGSEGQTVASEWVPFTSIAKLQYRDKVYVAGSEYGLLPKGETVYELTALSTSLDISKEWESANDWCGHAQGLPVLRQ